MFVVSEDLRLRLKKKHLLLAQYVYPSRACITLGPAWSNAKQSLVDSPEHKALGFPSAGDQWHGKLRGEVKASLQVLKIERKITVQSYFIA